MNQVKHHQTAFVALLGALALLIIATGCSSDSGTTVNASDVIDSEGTAVDVIVPEQLTEDTVDVAAPESEDDTVLTEAADPVVQEPAKDTVIETEVKVEAIMVDSTTGQPQSPAEVPDEADPIEAPAIEIPDTRQTAPTDFVRVYTAFVSNARSCARLDCGVIQSFPPGTPLQGISEVTGSEFAGDSNWWKINYEDQTLYIHASLVNVP